MFQVLSQKTVIKPLALAIALSMNVLTVQVYADSNTTTVLVNSNKTVALPKSSSTANDQNQIYQMTPIVVQAEKEDTIQFGQSVLNQKAIDRYQANNVAQLLDNMPSVGSAGSPRPGGQTINILGMGGVEDVSTFHLSFNI